MPEFVEKVFAYITYQDKLLVFRHTRYPEAGIQVPAGTVEIGEDPLVAARREATEETGLINLGPGSYLGVDDFDLRPYGGREIHRRQFFHFTLETSPPDEFSHWESSPSSGEDESFEFQFWWAKIPDEVPWLIAGHSRFLPELCQRLGLPVGDLEYQAQFSVSWNEADAEKFLAVGRYFVPEREHQINLFCELVPDPGEPFRYWELCCGEGLLAEAILERFPHASVTAFDGSWNMLRAARLRLEPFGDRVKLRHFELTSSEWRKAESPMQMIVSSLGIHHLDGAQKRLLFADMYKLLAPGGAFVIADLFLPAGERGQRLAASGWDEEVLRRSLELDGHDHFYQEFRNNEWNMFRFPDPVDKPSGIFEQLQWLAEAGFQEVDVYWLRAGHALFGGVKPGKMG
jgi:tRNA (cmo5U34)-methyltransferase